MGFLFENMEKMDIQAERRNTQREKERADRAEKGAEDINEETYLKFSEKIPCRVC